jgi:UDP-N-acetylmuramoyl-L-alanyl-D-glutamate--2,6-diaminopimelate ligase
LTDPAGSAAAVAAGVPVLVVPDVRALLGSIASRIYGDPAAGLLMFGVTGTNGKTTTTYLLEAGLRAAGRRTGLIGTVETRFGDDVVRSVRTTPEAPDLQALLAVMRERGIEAVAMEVSSHALALGRVDGIRFDVAVFTNLSQDHLDFHTDMADYFAAKRRLFEAARSRRAVVNVDDEHGALLASSLAHHTEMAMVSVSPSGQRPAQWRGRDVTSGPDGSTFTLLGPGTHAIDGATAIPGAFNATNAMLAIVALHEAGVPLAVARDGVRDCLGVPGRMERVDAGQPFLALVDYAHTPEAVRSLLAAVRSLTAGQVIAVLGCGGDRDASKRRLMGAALEEGADVAVLTSDNPRSEDPMAILAEMAAGAPNGRVIPDRTRAIEYAVARARPGDVVVVAGKGHEAGQEYADRTVPFDDREVLRAALSAAGSVV